MTTADSVIASIDRALGDFEASPDAMRWTPEPPPAPVSEYVCRWCEDGIRFDEECEWQSTGDFGGTVSGIHEALYCVDSPDKRHGPTELR